MRRSRGGGGGFRVACLNFKIFRVGVLSMLMSLSEIERKWFVSVGILSKVDKFEPQHI